MSKKERPFFGVVILDFSLAVYVVIDLTSAVAGREVTPLAHEVRDNPMELGTLVPESGLPDAQLSKVLFFPIRPTVVIE